MNVEQPPLDASVVSSNQGLMRELQGLDGYEENFKLKNEKLSNYASFVNGEGDIRLSMIRNSYINNEGVYGTSLA